MKQSTVISLLIAFIASVMPAFAQQPEETSERSKWFKEIREYKHNFFSKELALSAEQQEQFFPLYDTMEDEITKLNNETRELEQKIRDTENPTDLEYETATTAMLELKNKEYEIEKSSYEKFSRILSKKQLFKLKGAERQFTRGLMKHHRRLHSGPADKNKPAE